MEKNKQKSFLNQLNSKKYFPFIVGVCAGLYPLFFYYSNNFPLINSWGHFYFFVGTFLLLPTLLCFVFWHLFSITFLQKWQKYVLPFFGVFLFLFLLKVAVYAGIQKKITVGVLILSFAFAGFLYTHFKKVIGFQLLLAGVGFVTLIPALYSRFSLETNWLAPVDDIATIQLVKKPNIYVIQPDGYVNFSEISKGYYNLDASEMEAYFEANNFIQFPDFRTNYGSTLSSNSATFMMKHHYYNGSSSFSEGLNARNILITDNTTLTILKNNGYHTNLILEKPYLLVNKPTMGYDYSNINVDDVPFISTGLDIKRNVVDDLNIALQQSVDAPRFYFIEYFSPGHITNNPSKKDKALVEKEKWIENLEHANHTVKKLVNTITALDKEALIIILADHGGYVGLNNAAETTIKTTDRDLIYSMFSAQLSIKSPYSIPEKYKGEFVSSINVFRVLFSFLANNDSYLNNVQENASYMIIKKGAPSGVYKYLNEKGEVVFEKVAHE